jgi:hypothetical protein
MKSPRLLLLLLLPAVLHAQHSPRPATVPLAPSVEANRKALNVLFEDYWQDQLKHNA